MKLKELRDVLTEKIFASLIKMDPKPTKEERGQKNIDELKKKIEYNIKCLKAKNIKRKTIEKIINGKILDTCSQFGISTSSPTTVDLYYEFWLMLDIIYNYDKETNAVKEKDEAIFINTPGFDEINKNITKKTLYEDTLSDIFELFSGEIKLKTCGKNYSIELTGTIGLKNQIKHISLTRDRISNLFYDTLYIIMNEFDKNKKEAENENP